jgi:hypothetical protein
LARIAASIGILIVHTPPYQPEGRGKIERFFRSVREQFLASLDPKTLLSIEQINERWWHWLDTVYHRHEHAAAPMAARYRTGPPASAGHRFTASVLPSRGPAGAPRFYLPVEESFLRSAVSSGRQAHPWVDRGVRFDPLDLTQLEMYSEGKPEGVARLGDAVVNGMLPPRKTEEK